MVKRIFVAGHKGLVGSALSKQLSKDETIELVVANKQELDLTNQTQVNQFFKHNNIHQVYLAAAKVGGIYANSTYPAEFIYQNLMIQNNVIHAAYEHQIERLLFLGSSCIYPKVTEQPIKETALLTGKLEPTNEPYAIAKIAGIKQCESYNRQYGCDFRSVMPTNLYGENDNFHPSNSHVIPALIHRFHQAKINNAPYVTVWGTGNARREFLYVDDMAEACIHIMNLDKATFQKRVTDTCSHLNIGTGSDISIRELADQIRQTVGYRGDIRFDTEKPDGTPIKRLNVSKINKLGWHAKTELESGLNNTYIAYLKHKNIPKPL